MIKLILDEIKFKFKDEPKKVYSLLKSLSSYFTPNQKFLHYFFISKSNLNRLSLPKIIPFIFENVKSFIFDNKLYIVSLNPLKTVIVNLENLDIENCEDNTIIIPNKFGNVCLFDLENFKIYGFDYIQTGNILYTAVLTEKPYKNEEKKIKNEYPFKIIYSTNAMRNVKGFYLDNIKSEYYNDVIFDDFKLVVKMKTVYFTVWYKLRNKSYISYYSLEGVNVVNKEIDEFGNVVFSGTYLNI